MNTFVLIGLCTAIFCILPLVFRSNAVYMLLLLCIGDVVAKLIGQDVTQIINSVVNVNMPVMSVVQVFLAVILPLVALPMFRGSVRGVKQLFQVVPAVSATMLAMMFIVAKLPYDLQQNIQQDALYGAIEVFFPVAAVAGALTAFFYVLSLRPKHDAHDKKHHR